MLVLAIIPVGYYLYKEVGLRISHSIEAQRELRSYLEQTCADPDIAFHGRSSTLPIPFKDIDGVDHRDIQRAIVEKLHSRSLKWMLLVGDLGAGKTATLSLLFVHLVHLYLTGKSSAVPIFIRMRNNWRPEDVEGALSRYVNLKVLRRLKEKKKFDIVLLLDSLDEFAMQYGHSLTLSQVVENVLCSPFLKGCVVIMTTRPNVIADLDRNQRYRDVFPDQHRLLDLQYADVEEYVRSKGLEASFKSLNPDARYLLTKPLFLYFFVTASQGSEGPGRRQVEFTDEAQLYEWFFVEWYSRAQTQMGLENPLPDIGQIRRFLELIAIESASSENGSLDEEQIRFSTAKLIQDSPHLNVFLDAVFGQAKARWLLVPRLEAASKRYQFIHPSLADYFLSGPLAKFYVSGEFSPGFGLSHFSDLLLLFVKARLSAAPDLAALLRSRVEMLKEPSKDFPDVCGAISVVLWLEYGAESLALENEQMSWLQQEWKRIDSKAASGLPVALRGAVRRVRLQNVLLKGLLLQGYDWSRGSDLAGAKLAGCTFVGSASRFRLSSAKMDGVTLQDCQFIAVELLDAALTAATFENCHFDACQLQRAKAGGAVFRNCHFSNCDLGATDLSRAEFHRVIFEDCRMGGAVMDKVTSQASTMRRCDL